MIKNQFEVMAAYHAAMNRQVFASCEALTESQLKDDSGLFFKSIFGTLNHMLLTDRIWLATFQGKKYDYKSLDQIIFSAFTELK
ncbi:MAG: DinB family protein, partial [Gammaproteobacteria bacterium]|nr:DinB family protein [Gammaproteobacteria bacterium]